MMLARERRSGHAQPRLRAARLPASAAFAASAALLAAGLAAQDGEPQISRIVVAGGTRWETHAVLVDSGVDGPEVAVIGGIHGNEPAGYRAARQIADWRPTAGRLLVLPRSNELALTANQRRTPGLPRADGDLNRQFPDAERDEPNGVLATAIWRLVRERAPDLLLDLHEGYDFTQLNPKSVGSSVITDGSASTVGHARAMLAALDPTIREHSPRPAKKEFVLKAPAVSGSLARACARHGIPSMILETTIKGQALAYRVRQHRILVHAALTRLGMLTHGPHRMVPEAADGVLRVGLYVSTGVSGKGPARLESLLDRESGFVVRRLCAADVRTGALEQFDVVVFPGGSGSGQGKAIGADGRERVRQFVRSGKGYVGLCAGAYLAANNYSWSLGILDADVVDRAHWRRGRATIPLTWTDRGRGLDIVPTATRTTPVLYANGPLYAPALDPDVPDFEVLARFAAEVRNNDAPIGIMLDKPAVVVGDYGQGRVVCSSPHPEQTIGLEGTMRALVRLAANRP